MGMNFNALAQATAPRPPQQSGAANAFMAGQQIRNNRTRNQIAEAQLKSQREREQRLKNRRDTLRMHDRYPDAVRELMKAGDYEGAFAIAQQGAKVLNSELKLAGQLSEAIGDEAAYERFRSSVIAQGSLTPEELPEKYSDSAWKQVQDRKRNQLNKVIQVVSDVDAESGEIMMKELQLNARGETIQESDEFLSPQDKAFRQQAKMADKRVQIARFKAAKTGKPFEMTGSIYSQIARAVASAVGGDWDEKTGQFKLKDINDREKAIQALAAAENEVRRSEGRTLPSQAVLNALNSLRYFEVKQMGGLGQGQTPDPRAADPNYSPLSGVPARPPAPNALQLPPPGSSSSLMPLRR